MLFDNNCDHVALVVADADVDSERACRIRQDGKKLFRTGTRLCIPSQGWEVHHDLLPGRMCDERPQRRIARLPYISVLEPPHFYGLKGAVYPVRERRQVHGRLPRVVVAQVKIQASDG